MERQTSAFAPPGRSAGGPAGGRCGWWLLLCACQCRRPRPEAPGLTRVLRRVGRGPGANRPWTRTRRYYYLDPDEPPGRWWGQGRASIGLDGTVTGEQLRRRSTGVTPKPASRWAGVSVTRRRGGSTRRFSSPKSVSVLWALTPDPWVRAEVLAAHDVAVDAALGWFERHGVVTRRGRDGVFQVDTLGGHGGAVPPAHLPVDRPSAPHPRRRRGQGPGPHRPVAVARRPLPQAPAAQHRRRLRHRPSGRAHRPTRCQLGRPRDRCLRSGMRPRLGAGGVLEAHRPSRLHSPTGPPVDRRPQRHPTTAADDRQAPAGRRRAVPTGQDPPRRQPRAARRIRAPRPGPSDSIPTAPLPERIADRRTPTGSIPDEHLVDEALLHVAEESSAWLRADLARHLTAVLDGGAATSGADAWWPRSTGSPPSPRPAASPSDPNTTPPPDGAPTGDQ